MKLGLQFINQIQGSEDTGQVLPTDDGTSDGLTKNPTRWGFTALTFRQIVAAVTAAYHTEHNDDDTHKTIHATGKVFERGRTLAIGDRTEVAFVAGNYNGAGAMTWTVTVAQQVAFAYELIGTTCYLTYWIDSGTIGGTLSTGLKIKLPANLVVAGYATAPIHYVNTTSGAGYARAIPGDSFITLYRADDSNWAAGAVTIHGQIRIKVSDGSGSVTVSSVDPILTYTGGANNFTTTPTLPLTVAGTYTITVNRPMTVVVYGVAGGGGGGTDASPVSGAGAGGGGGGASHNTGLLTTLIPGKSYTAIVGAAGVANTSGGATSFVNTSDTVTVLSLTGGIAGGNNAVAGAGGTVTTGAGGVAGGAGGAGGNNGTGLGGTAAVAGCGGGGGAGGGNGATAGGGGGNGSAAGGVGGNITGTNGGNNGGLAGGGGQGIPTGTIAGGGGGGGGCQIAGVTGAFGGGGGGGAYTTGTGGTALGGIVAFAFISAP